MAGLYPENQELSIFGEQVPWPGVDSKGKFTNGSFTNPLEKPSFIPAETINLILDNLGELIKKLGETPNNATIDQLAKLFTSAPTENKAIMRDEHGRAKVAAPEADDDIARKLEIRNLLANEIPLPPPTESGAVGVAGVLEALSRADHQHPSELEAYSFQKDFFFLKFRNGFLMQGLKVSNLTADRYEEKTLPHACTSFNYATAVNQWNVEGRVGSVNVELSLSKIRFKSTVSSINAWFLIFGI